MKKNLIFISILIFVSIVGYFSWAYFFKSRVSADQAMEYIYQGKVDSVVNTHLGFTIHLKGTNEWLLLTDSDNGRFGGLFMSCGSKCKNISYGQE